MTQIEMVADYIERFGSITPMDAFYDLGITKLATRISEMKKRGYKFKTETIAKENRFGKVCYFSKYSWGE